MTCERKPETSQDKPPHVCTMWVDNANMTRVRLVPRARFEARNFQVSLTTAMQSMPCMYDVPFETPVGEVQIIPERAHMYTASWLSDATICFGDMTKYGQPWAHCPRTFLRRQLTTLREKHGIAPTVGFEMEFQLLSPDTNEPVDTSLYCDTHALHQKGNWRVLKRIVEVLQTELNIPVHQYHPESASGQFEISIGTFGADDEAEDVEAIVRAVDKLVLARQTVHGVAAEFDYRATFVPKLRLNEAGSAAHLHLGLLDVSTPLSEDTLFEADSAKAQAFLAGVLQELPHISILLAATYNSYERLQPKCWAGAYQCYGYENREAPIRLICSELGNFARVNHFEVKTLDATANPYVAVGAVLAAGMIGLENNLPLPPPVNVDPETLPEGERPQPLPRSIDEAVASFQARADVWRSVLSPSYFDLLVQLRSAEAEFHGNLIDQFGNRTKLLAELTKRY
ncbi:TPA: hypothetical protein N0F65_011003 [Lagenidium giganteum]|uniref:GS catalytic domain-containing protein n=1 Tax=Lagenidium giganteum TaxID=4803 RepID=A0AAV2Z598_9STRA|nr:TPA: hypothetical protein N0F65_011003 [Lagenidium giganteum]